MSKAIRISLKKAPVEYDLGASKFFGTPTVPLEWESDFRADEIFLCQIKLSDIAELDSDKLLPRSGYLYVFLHTGEGIYRLRPHVRYFDGEPGLAIDDFNCAVEGYEHLNEAYLMEFSETGESESCTRLFGVPSGESSREGGRLLMQLDPLDSGMGFLDSLDGYIYLFFGENESDLSEVTLEEDYS